PVLAQYMTQSGFRLQTGPQLGILTSGKFADAGGNVERNVKEDMSNIDFSWVFGAGFLFPGGVGIDARYNLGITDVWEGPAQLKNSVFQLGLFYQFMHGKSHSK
ncbi:MAG: PorT family protein, partial [Sphingobacteriales bacterium]